MKKIRINLIFTLVSLAVLALLLIQFFQIGQIYDRKASQFTSKSITLAERVALIYEKEDNLKNYISVVDKNLSKEYKEMLKKEFQHLLAPKETISIKDTNLIQNGKVQKFMIIQGKSYDSLSGVSAEHRVIARDVRELRQIFNRESGALPKNDSFLLSVQLDERVMQQIFRKSKYFNDLMIKTFKENIYEEPSVRIDLSLLDSILTNEINRDDLPNKYQFFIVNDKGKAIEFENPSPHYNLTLDTSKTVYTNLFPGNILDDQLFIHITFPTKKTFILKEVLGILVISIGLVVLIIISLIIMFKTIIMQKKLGELKNDFISNMTHEFKTPIATISLACQAMNDEDMMGGGIGKAAPFVKMISDENNRLGMLVEKIFQSSSIDKGELKLKIETVDLTEIVERIARSSKIKIEALQGVMISSIPQIPIHIVADREHTENAIAALLDNAIKYSHEAPDVYISLKSEGKRVTLSIKDKGIGISKEHITKIFDKLYRVPTGNIHKVKGFGLGLSYVKSIAELNGWNIEVRSKLNEGSEFKLIINN